MRLIVTGLVIALCTGCEVRVEGSGDISTTAPRLPSDHLALLESPDEQAEANKRLVYNMYRVVLQAGLADRAGEFFAENYVEHQPGAEQGLAGLQQHVRDTRTEREVQERLELPLISMTAEGDYVTTAFSRAVEDDNGRTYYTTWFDLYRIEDGRIAEHWDPMLKDEERVDPALLKLAG